MTSRRSWTIIDHAVAALWGAAEASAFFVVPDVWLSRLVLHDPKRAYLACGSALAGALVGGILTRAWVQRVGAERSRAAMRALPSISDEMITRVEDGVREGGFRAAVAGPTKGVPYKLYVRAAALENIGLGPMLAWSVPGRLPRFLAVTALGQLLQAGTSRVIGRERTSRIQMPTHTLVWIAFYSWYFTHVGREPQLPSSGVAKER